MTDRNKFEEMLELLINEDKDAAEALFHEIVVEKSRDIYQSILESDDEDLDEADDEDLDESDDEDLDESDDEDLDESDDEELDESDDEDLDESDDEDLDEMFGLDEFEMEADPMMGGDATDDIMGDMGMDDEGGDMGMDDMDGAGDVDSRVDDLEDALEALKAEFDAMMGGQDDDEEGDMDDMDDESEEGEEGEEEPEKEAFAYESKHNKADKKDDKKEKKSSTEQMREYVEKVGGDRYDSFGKMGDNGANTKSTVAGKNDMGGTTANIAKSSTEAGTEANKGQLKGNGLLNGSPKPMNTKNVNVVGAKGATKMSNQPGHGAEKKGKPETADKSAGSMLNGAPKRAK